MPTSRSRAALAARMRRKRSQRGVEGVVGQPDAGHVHARGDHVLQRRLRVGGRADGGDDLGATSHGRHGTVPVSRHRRAFRPRPTPDDRARPSHRGRYERGTSFHGASLSVRTSPGSPSTRSPRMFFITSVVPPSIELARMRRKAFWWQSHDMVASGRTIS